MAKGAIAKELLAKKIADALGVTVSYLTLEEGELESPALTSTQSEELKAVIAAAIDQYFTIIQPQIPPASAPLESAAEIQDDVIFNEDDPLED